jgi:3',5'-cyclic AMP phosphodiesterase CpdA
MVKLAHISDFHVADRARYPRAGITPKQADKYSVKLLQGRLKLLREMEVDHLVVTGDLTLSGEASEFKRAAELLKHFTEAGRLTVLPGNHDVWTADAHESRRFERVIGPQGAGVRKPNGPLYPRLVELSPEVVLLALDTARYGEDPFTTSGRLGNGQIHHAREVAREHGVNQGKAVILALHHHLVVPPQREEQNRWAARMPLFDADQVVRLVAEPLPRRLPGGPPRGERTGSGLLRRVGLARGRPWRPDQAGPRLRLLHRPRRGTGGGRVDRRLSVLR